MGLKKNVDIDYLMSTNKSSVLGLNTLNRDSIMKGSIMNESIKDSNFSPSKNGTFIESSGGGGKVIKCCKLCNIPVPDTCWRR